MMGESVLTRAQDQHIAGLQARLRACRLCEERGFISRAHPIVAGREDDRILVIGQAPGHVSVERDRPFSGSAGRVLDSWFQRAGFPAGSLHDRVYISSLTRCDPGKNVRGGGDRRPSPAEIALCRPYLETELALLQPAVIMLVGTLAISYFLGDVRLEAVVGRAFDARDVVWRPLWPGHEAVHVLPLPHSSGVSRWLNDPGHQQLLAQAIAQLGQWRVDLGLSSTGSPTAHN